MKYPCSKCKKQPSVSTRTNCKEWCKTYTKYKQVQDKARYGKIEVEQGFQIRCVSCGKLLAKVLAPTTLHEAVEVMCPRCKKANIV